MYEPVICRVRRIYLYIDVYICVCDCVELSEVCLQQIGVSPAFGKCPALHTRAEWFAMQDMTHVPVVRSAVKICSRALKSVAK